MIISIIFYWMILVRISNISKTNIMLNSINIRKAVHWIIFVIMFLKEVMFYFNYNKKGYYFQSSINILIFLNYFLLICENIIFSHQQMKPLILYFSNTLLKQTVTIILLIGLPVAIPFIMYELFSIFTIEADKINFVDFKKPILPSSA